MKYLRITETPRGRIIEAWVGEEAQPLLPPQAEESTNTPSRDPLLLMALSLFGWGFLGIALGNLIFY